MNATFEGPKHLHVTLSERNLRALLHKVTGGMGDSACTLVRETDAGVWVTVTAEADEQHYTDRPPGLMHPLTEAALKK